MKFDLSLLVPSWVWEEENVKQFLLAVQESLDELALEVDDLWYVWEIWKAESPGEWFERFLEKIGLACGLSESDVRKLVEAGIDFLRRKGSVEFFEKMLKQLGETFKVTDMIEEIMVLSSGRRLSQHYLQDGLRYRDGSVVCEVGQSGFRVFVVLKDKFVPLGVYLWLVVYAAVLGAMCWMSSGGCFGAGLSMVEEVDFQLKEAVRGDIGLQLRGGNKVWLEVEDYRVVLNEDVFVVGYRVVLNEGVLVGDYRVVLNEGVLVV